MNINIAFNTIIYIMVFLFPGVLFRRGFLSGKFNNKFHLGNIFERILWYILFSFVSIFLYVFLCYILNITTKSTVDIGFQLNSSQVITIFENLYENKFPDLFKDNKKIKDIVYILALLYLFSLLFGVLLNRVVVFCGLDKRISLFNLIDSWSILLTSNKKNNFDHKSGDIFFTKIDLKTNEDKLYTGELHELILDKEGKADAIILKNAFVYNKLDKRDTEKLNEIERVKLKISNKQGSYQEHSEDDIFYIYKKRILGSLFSVLHDRIENISITYIKVSNLYSNTIIPKFVIPFINVLVIILTLGAILNTVFNLGFFEFENTFKRVFFNVLTFIVVLSFLDIVKKFFLKTVSKEKIINNIIGIVVYSVFYLYVLFNVKLWIVILFFLFLLLISAFVRTIEKKSN